MNLLNRQNPWGEGEAPPSAPQSPGGPHEEDRVDAAQASIKVSANCEVAAQEVETSRQSALGPGFPWIVTIE